MSLHDKDYYEILGGARDATPEQIQKAFRELARKYHPDVSKDPKAGERFKEVNEAYEVLKDPDKRKKYDQLGSSWQQGQEFTPPPGWESRHFEFAGGDGGPSDFSDFFASLFGGRGFGGGFDGFGDRFGGAGRARAMRGDDVEAELHLSLAELRRGGKTEVKLRSESGATRNLAVSIPQGTTHGTRIRLAGQGGEGRGGGPAGDLYLRVAVDADPRFALEGSDLRTQVDVTPWDAALGAKVDVDTLDGKVELKVAPGSQSGQTLRLRGLGMPRSATERGDLLVKLRIVVPAELSDDERRLFEELRSKARFRPQDGQRQG